VREDGERGDQSVGSFRKDAGSDPSMLRSCAALLAHRHLVPKHEEVAVRVTQLSTVPPKELLWGVVDLDPPCRQARRRARRPLRSGRLVIIDGPSGPRSDALASRADHRDAGTMPSPLTCPVLRPSGSPAPGRIIWLCAILLVLALQTAAFPHVACEDIAKVDLANSTLLIPGEEPLSFSNGVACPPDYDTEPRCE